LQLNIGRDSAFNVSFSTAKRLYINTDIPRADPDKQQNQQSFFYFFRFNISTFTSLCRLFYNELKARLLELQDDDAELAVKITPALRRILPSLCLYNMWLISMVHMVVGLASEPFLAPSIAQFWPCYARAIDLIAQGFPIWDLEDTDDVSYMLEEDVDTIEFQPLMDAKTMKIWQDKKTGLLKRKFTDADVVKSSQDDEMLQRIKNFLSDGLYLTMMMTLPFVFKGPGSFVQLTKRSKILSFALGSMSRSFSTKQHQSLLRLNRRSSATLQWLRKPTP
jgi:hypothetical protein